MTDKPTFRLPRPDVPRFRLPTEDRQETPAYQQACSIRSGTRWQKVRLAKLTKDPLCEWCNAKPAEEVHHIQSVARHPELAHTESNLICLCGNCHRGIESAAKRGLSMQRLLEMRDGH